MKSKKAEFELKNIVAAILVIVFIIGSIMMALSIGKAADQKSKRDTCSESLKMSAIKLDGLADKFGNPVDIKCYTEYENYRTQDEQQIKKIIADKMVECWDQYGKGQMEIFNTKDANYCVVCSRLSFENDAELVGFTSFLNNNIAPMKKMSYLEYLAGVTVQNYQSSGFEGSEAQAADKLTITEPLAVMFTMGKNANPDAALGVEGTKTVTTAVGVGVGTGIGVVGGAFIVSGIGLCSTVIGCIPWIIAATILAASGSGALGYSVGASRTADWDAKVYLWPYDRLNELNCSYIEGQAGHLEIKQMD